MHRTDNDFAVAWAKMYGKGRVFYTTLGHVEANWDKPEMQAMITGAIKWALRLVDADITPRGACRWGPDAVDDPTAICVCDGIDGRGRIGAGRTGTANSASARDMYHSLSMDEMIVQLTRLKIPEIEMSRGEFMLFSEPEPEQFRPQDEVRRAGIGASGLYGDHS